MAALAQRGIPLSEQAISHLRDLILDGKYPPGRRLNEVELADVLGISRSPVREAIRKLAAEGLAQLVPHRGAFVAQLQASDVDDLYELREAIEGLAARLAATRAVSRDIGGLSDMLNSAKRALDAGEAAAYPSDSDFHELLLSACGNARVQSLGADIHRQLRLARIRSGAEPRRARRAYEEHVAILAALVARDPNQAERAMRRHIRHARRHVTEALQKWAIVEESSRPHPGSRGESAGAAASAT